MINTWGVKWRHHHSRKHPDSCRGSFQWYAFLVESEGWDFVRRGDVDRGVRRQPATPEAKDTNKKQRWKRIGRPGQNRYIMLLHFFLKSLWVHWFGEGAKKQVTAYVWTLFLCVDLVSLNKLKLEDACCVLIDWICSSQRNGSQKVHPKFIPIPVAALSLEAS